jgi:hypothetical protein
MYEYLKQREYPPERGYDQKILESTDCKIGRVNRREHHCLMALALVAGTLIA